MDSISRTAEDTPRGQLFIRLCQITAGGCGEPLTDDISDAYRVRTMDERRQRKQRPGEVFGQRTRLRHRDTVRLCPPRLGGDND